MASDANEIRMAVISGKKTGLDSVIQICPVNTVDVSFRYATSQNAGWKATFDGRTHERTSDEAGNIHAYYPEDEHVLQVGITSPQGLMLLPLPMTRGGRGVISIGTATPGAPEPRPPSANYEPDHTLIVIEADEAAKHVDEPQDVTAESIAKFLHGQRTNVPGFLQDFKHTAELLREFGAARFYTRVYGGKTYLIFTGNPHKEEKGLVAVRNLIRGRPRHLATDPVIRSLGILPRDIWQAGKKALKINIIVVATVDIAHEVIQDEASLARLGVTISVDIAKLAASMLIGTAAASLATMAAPIVVAGTPIVVIAVVTTAVSLGVGLGLDAMDEHFGVTKWLQDAALELEDKLEYNVDELFRQLHWCAMRAGRGCFY